MTMVDRELTPEQAQALRASTDESVHKVNSGAQPGKFVYFAAFDGTNNDKDHVPSGEYQTNVANLFDQAKPNENDYFKAKYYPGVGTGGINGGLMAAASDPSPAVNKAANLAYNEFVNAVGNYKSAHPEATPSDITIAAAGFSRGTATEVRFAHLVNERGVTLADGITQFAKPGEIKVSSMLMFDPVATFATQDSSVANLVFKQQPTPLSEDLTIPKNVTGHVLVLSALDEHRKLFRESDYAKSDPRVDEVKLPGNHCGVGGGYDLQGTAAAALEIGTAYFKNSGVAIDPVPENRRFDPTQPVKIYSESDVQIPASGNGHYPEIPYTLNSAAARSDSGPNRQTQPVPPPPSEAPNAAQQEQPGQATPATAPAQPAPAALTPADPGHPAHALYQGVRQHLASAYAAEKGVALPEAQLDNLSAAVTASASKSRMTEVNAMIVTTNRMQPDVLQVFAYQGRPGEPGKPFSMTPVDKAIDTPVEQSWQRFDQITAQNQAADLERQQQQQMRQQRGHSMSL